MQSESSRSNGLNVQQLMTFKLVYEENGYAAAARSSELSVPSVWQHIQALEKIYKVKLFQKQGRQIQATEAARRLYRALGPILEGLESTFDFVDSQCELTKRITLVTGMRMMLEDLAKPFADFRKQYPNNLTIRHGNNHRAEQLLLAGEADIGLSLEPGIGQASDRIHYEPAYSVDFLAVARKSHPFWKANSGSLKVVVKHDLIVTAPGTHGRDALEQALHRDRLTGRIVVETDNSGFTLACVQAGMGLGIVAGRSGGYLSKQLNTRSLKRQLGSRQIVFMWRKGRLLSNPLLDLIEKVQQLE